MNEFDEFVASLEPQTRNSVRSASLRVADARRTTLSQVFEDVDKARNHAASVKDYILDHLGDLLRQFETACLDNGVRVHWASDAESARNIILGICNSSAPPGATVVKGKSMATEEIHLNPALEEAGYRVVETDLGEFVVQLDDDTPSHIVAPIIHKDRYDVAKTFASEGIGDYTTRPEELASQARQYLRSQFKQSHVGISGVNFGIAESGRIVIVENEGNNRLSTTSPKVHIALMGIEKLLPRDADLPVFLKLLAGSATGQRVTVYTHFIQSPRKPQDLDGPDEVHLVLLDNGRTSVLNGAYRAILRCLRCGACLNICPVYRHASGHAYGHVYPGPLGAVLAPALEGVHAHGALAKASTLCGACQEVCPVAIPIPEMLLHLRDEATREGAIKQGPEWAVFRTLAQRDTLWRASLSMLPLATRLPSPWSKVRDNPSRRGRDFRRWFHDRS